MPNANSELPVVVQKAYELNLWLIKKVESFPRPYRFSVGDRLVQSVLDLLLRLVDAAYARDKASILTEVNGMLNRLRFLLRLAQDLDLLKTKSCGYAAEPIRPYTGKRTAMSETDRRQPATREDLAILKAEILEALARLEQTLRPDPIARSLAAAKSPRGK